MTSYWFEKRLERMKSRKIYPNEIVFDADHRKYGFEAINFIGIRLYNAGYNFEIYYAEGQKSPHLHVKNIYDLGLKDQQLRKYKELFIKKYTPKQYWAIMDYQICSAHAIAEENKPHYKYNSIKKLCGVWNKDKENYAEEGLILEAKEEIRVEFTIDPNAILLKDKIKITDIARKYGYEVKNNKILCPFHADKDPSLSLSDKKGVFYCFGCGVKGDIITFYKMLGDLKND